MAATPVSTHCSERGRACVQGFGYAVSLLGFVWYNQIKMQASKPAEYTSLPSHESAKSTA